MRRCILNLRTHFRKGRLIYLCPFHRCQYLFENTYRYKNFSSFQMSLFYLFLNCENYIDSIFITSQLLFLFHTFSIIEEPKTKKKQKKHWKKTTQLQFPAAVCVSIRKPVFKRETRKTVGSQSVKVWLLHNSYITYYCYVAKSGLVSIYEMNFRRILAACHHSTRL